MSVENLVEMKSVQHTQENRAGFFVCLFSHKWLHPAGKYKNRNVIILSKKTIQRHKSTTRQFSRILS